MGSIIMGVDPFDSERKSEALTSKVHPYQLSASLSVRCILISASIKSVQKELALAKPSPYQSST